MILRLAMGALLTCSFVWWAAPRVYLLTDRRLARRRLGRAGLSPSSILRRSAGPHHEVARQSGADPHLQADHTSQPHHTGRAHGPDTTRHINMVELASFCDAIGRSVRSGRSTPEAVIESVDRLDVPSPTLRSLRSRLAGGEPLSAVMSATRGEGDPTSDERLCLDLIDSSIVGSSVVAGGIEHAATTLREVATMRADLDVASAQARLSARVLTLLPLVVVAGGLATSQSFRSSVTSRGVLVPLIVGLVLTRLGWTWIVRMLRAVTDGAARFELAEIVDRICVSLMAGCTLPEACSRLGNRIPDDSSSGTGSSTGLAIAARIGEGRPLVDALEPLASAYGLTGRLFADLLVSAERDGLPVVASVARVAQDVRMERRRHVDTAIRRIPVRLTVPLVTCILPGFMLTTLVPLVAASLDTLTVTLPNVLSPLGS